MPSYSNIEDRLARREIQKVPCGRMKKSVITAYLEVFCTCICFHGKGIDDRLVSLLSRTITFAMTTIDSAVTQDMKFVMTLCSATYNSRNYFFLACIMLEQRLIIIEEPIKDVGL